MNRPPAEFTTVQPGVLREYVTQLLSSAGMGAEQAALLADLLVTNDLRGVFSHGSLQSAAYVDHFRAGRLNPTAEISIFSESPSTLVLDGGGGLGYFPCHQAATRLIPKAQASGISVATTRNHGHFGAAGIYARIPLAHDLLTFVTSGHQLDLHADQFVMAAAGGSPMAFGIPTGSEPPFALDFGAVHDMYLGPDGMAPVMELVPSAVLRSFGLGCVCQALGGLLCGLPVDAERAGRKWSGADQGSFMIAVDIERLFPAEQFKAEMDEYARRVRRMLPLPGLNEARLPGAVEWECERQFGETGIPVGPRHAEALRKHAADYSLVCPV
jgi:LDH2 family malate/lactate/ureidoglycolate dehydrogenase